ncbi:MAG: thiol:disulfide interchange protein DsbA/DsbL [Gammaproteobacteria bacterium]|nr:MAG: thiol:disulfide interchange protein DsbA/DsbL [Gammaproteobacteria bacterium]
MKRILFTLLMLLPLVSLADTPAPGMYKPVNPPLPGGKDGKIQVVELFWYGCPHCYHFEEYVEKWAPGLADDVEFVQLPAVFRRNWVPAARAHFAAQALGVLDRFHRPYFDALHKERRRLFREEAILDFVEELGIDRDEFRKAYNSFAVDARVREAMKYTMQSGITGVPAMVVNGKYWTAASLAGDFERMLEVVNGLIEREREAAGTAP